VGQDWSAPGVPYAIEVPDRAPKERYYAQEFFDLEAELLWPRVWQMACRLEEIPEPGDFAVYDILDQSVVVVRGADMEVRAFQNVCRHRGVTVAEGAGNCGNEFICPFHGWGYGLDGTNTRIPMRKSFDAHNLARDDVNLTPVRCELWGACAWINLDDDAPPLRRCIEPTATILDAWKVESLRTEWWYACRIPANWKLAQQAFQEQYHVVQAHPQLVIPGMRYGARGATFDPQQFVDAEIRYLQTMSEGMAGMVHATDVRIAEGLRGIELPADEAGATETWFRTLNDAVLDAHRAAGHDVPDLNELAARGLDEPMGYCFPHWFVLPMYSSASSYRFRPLGPEETLMEIWSLTRYPEGAQRPRPTRPEVWDCDDPRWPPIPAQDFSNLPRQQRGLHAKAFEYMRLSTKAEGHLCNFERVVDGFLAGLPWEKLLPVLSEVNGNPLTRPAVDIRF
jgi:phenylpropionate dioxygenase-like ring-hydroxylating dioxygenase large terminal subunit